MKREIVTCDFCKREITSEERYVVDAKLRRKTPGDRGGQRNADMCPRCFRAFCKACEEAAK